MNRMHCERYYESPHRSCLRPALASLCSSAQQTPAAVQAERDASRLDQRRRDRFPAKPPSTNFSSRCSAGTRTSPGKSSTSSRRRRLVFRKRPSSSTLRKGQQVTRIYVTADQKYAFTGELVPFGADPFAEAPRTAEGRQWSLARTEGCSHHHRRIRRPGVSGLQGRAAEHHQADGRGAQGAPGIPELSAGADSQVGADRSEVRGLPGPAE